MKRRMIALALLSLATAAYATGDLKPIRTRLSARARHGPAIRIDRTLQRGQNILIIFEADGKQEVLWSARPLGNHPY